MRLSLLTGDAGYEAAALSALRLVRDAMVGAPTGFGQALCALDLYVGPAREVAIVGDPTAAQTRTLADEITGRVFRPNVVLAVGQQGDQHAQQTVPLLRDREARDGAATAYVCEGFVCRLPVTEAAALRAQLDTV